MVAARGLVVVALRHSLEALRQAQRDKINSHTEPVEVDCLFCCKALRQAQGDRTVWGVI